MSAHKLNQYYLTLWGAEFALGAGRGTEQNFIQGELCPIVQPLTLLYTIFDRRGTPFIYLLLINGTLSHTVKTRV